MKMALLSHNDKVAYQKELTKNQQHSKMISFSDIQLVSQDILQRYTNNMRMQSKQQLIHIKCPQITIGTTQHSKQFRKRDLKKWLSELCHSVFSIAYNSFKKSQMSEQEMKVYCSENLLLNLIKLSETNILAVEDYEYIDKVLKNDILSYYKDKYPPTLQKQSYKRFKAEIQDIDTMGELEKELVKVSNLQMEFGKKYQEHEYEQRNNNDNNRQYYDLIMQFINFCLQLPDKKHETNQQDGKSYYEEFRILMTNIFSKVQDINFMRGKKIEGKSQKNNKAPKQKENTQPNIQKSQNENNLKENKQEKIQRSKKQIEQKKIAQIQKSQKEIQQQQEYRQKVKKYTHYKIGRKIPQHIHKFTEQQIKDKNITVKDPSLLRFLTKWLQQLEENLENVQYKLKQAGSGVDYKKAKEIKSKRKQLMKLYQNKIYEQQRFCDYSYLDEKQIYQIPQNDKLVGIFSYMASQNQSTFIIKSINSIIHNLCQTTYDYDRFKIPSITCKIGDLIRCKCSSQQKQILKIYQQLKNYSRQNPQIFKIVRTKNRLQKGTKDILINVLFKNTILCQIQLSINQDQSSQTILNSFNHYLYQLQRSKFGPINELANVWTKDQRYGHITKILVNNWKKKAQNQCECKIEMQQQKNPFPFICSYCDRYYDKNNCFIQHKKCPNCKIWKCSYCSLDEIVQKRTSLLMEYSQRDDCQSLKLGEQDVKIPKYGMFISKASKTKNFIEFKSFDLPSQNNIYLVAVEGNINKIIDTVCKDKQEQFFNNKIVFRIKKIDKLQTFNDEQFKKTLLFPKNIKALYKNQSETIKLSCNYLNNQQFDVITKGQKKNYENIKFLDIKRNKIGQLSPIFTRFKNLQYLNLTGNKIQQIPKEIENMNNLTQLYLGQNQIKTIHQSFGNLKNLTTLDLYHNYFSAIPQQLTNLKNLTMLTLRHNDIETIPQSFGNLQNLKTLDISWSCIKTIHQSFSNLKSLTTLDMEHNRMETIPEQITNLKNLTTLNLRRNEIETIPQSFGNLKSLTTLELGQNKIKTIHQSFGNLQNLTKLTIYQNNIETIPQSFGNLSSLTYLDFRQNQIQTIPQSFGNLSSLAKLGLSKNKITTIPQSFANLKSLTTLEMQHNQIQTIPQSFGNLSSLALLCLSQNQITTIPQSFGNLNNLDEFWIQGNKIETIPSSIYKLVNLSILKLSSNKINLTRQLVQLLMGMRAKIYLKQNEISLNQEDRKWIRQNKLDKKIFFQ